MGWLTLVAVVAILYGFLLNERLDQSDATNKKQFVELENRLAQLERAIYSQLDRLDDNLKQDLEHIDRHLERLQQAIASLPADLQGLERRLSEMATIRFARKNAPVG